MAAGQEVSFAQNGVRQALLLSVVQNRLGLEAADSLAEVERQQFDLEKSLQTAFVRQPEYLSRKMKIVREEIRVAYAQNQQLPQLDLKAEFTMNGLGPTTPNTISSALFEDYNTWSIGAEFSIPVGGIKGNSEYRAAKLREKQALLDLHAIEVALTNNLDMSIRMVNNTYKQWQQSFRVVENRIRLLESELSGLEAGKSNSQLVLAREAALIEAKEEALSKNIAYQKARYGVLLAEGTLLEKFGLEQPVLVTTGEKQAPLPAVADTLKKADQRPESANTLQVSQVVDQASLQPAVLPLKPMVVATPVALVDSAPKPAPTLPMSKKSVAPAGSPHSEPLVEELLQQAERDFAEDRLTQGKEGYALEKYTQVLSLDPTNSQAFQGVERISARLSELAERDMESMNLTLPPGRNALEKYRFALKLNPDNRAALAGVKILAVKLVEAAEGDMTQLRLSAPPGNNALEKFTLAQSLDRDNPAAQQGAERVLERYLWLAQRASQQQKWVKAGNYLRRAAEVFPDEEQVVNAMAQLQQQRGGV
ncbi:MAG: TolC family protein [Magnetococcales bacterium]|nr:TolC family protein [Magnetococcales bacterium]